MNEVPGLQLGDRYNEVLVANTHPPEWKNPEPAPRYNMVVLGAGSAGLTAAAGAATLGGKVALVEKHLLGGDCLNTGCVPSKSILRSSRVIGEIERASEYGIRVTGEVEVDFPAVMERMRRIRSEISEHDSAQRFTELGVDVFLGGGHFAGPDTIEVDDKTLRFKKAMIATGSRPAHPPIEGLAEAGYITNETAFSLTERPARLAVIGGGPIGCELSQAFQRLGSQVTLLHRSDHVLNKEDADAAEIVQNALIRDGIDLALNCSVTRVTQTPEGKVVHYGCPGLEGQQIVVDEILVSIGRKPSVEGLDLEAAGVEYDQARGVLVNDLLRTSNPRIYAAGDVCLQYKFTHTAGAAARVALANALFPLRVKMSSLTIPWTTYTDPEVAHVGLYERDAVKQGIAVQTFVQPLSEVDRAVTDSEEEGFVKVHVKKGTDKIIGATIVARHAGEMISEITLAMAGNIGLKKLANVIHPYPTQADAIRMVAETYNHTRLTPRVKSLLSRWMAWTR